MCPLLHLTENMLLMEDVFVLEEPLNCDYITIVIAFNYFKYFL